MNKRSARRGVHAVRRGADGPLGRRGRAGLRRLGEERVVVAGERVGQFADHAQARARDERLHRARGRTRAGARSTSEIARLAGGAAGAVVLQRHLDQHEPRDARGLGQHRRRVRDVLDDVREDREVVRARPRRARARRRRPRAARRAGSREHARDLDRRRGQLEAVEAAAATASDSAASSAPSPQPISTTRAGESPARAHSSTAWAALDRAPIARQRPIFRLCSWSSSE